MSIKTQKDLLQAGIATPGDLVFSPTLDVSLSDYDRIQLTWPEGLPFDGEVIRRGMNINSPMVDSTTYEIINVDQCIQANPLTGSITNYTPNVDFSYNGKNITWLGTSNIPQNQSLFSIKYKALIDWIVFVPPQPRRERGTNLGQFVILRRKHSAFNGV
jgi:hypothetical protein